MWRRVFFFTNFNVKVILYCTPISTIWRPHTVFHVLLYTSFTRLLPLQSCLTFFHWNTGQLSLASFFLLLNVLPVMLVRRERSSVTVIFLSCARVRILLLVGCFILFIHSWNAGNFLGSFLLASLYPKWCLPLYAFPLLPLVLSQGFLALFYQEHVCFCIPVVSFSVEPPSHFIIFLFNTFWKLNQMRKVLVRVSNLYMFNNL